MNRDYHDGGWAIRQFSPYKRVDWENRHRERTIGLFGPGFFYKEMEKRVRRSLDAGRTANPVKGTDTHRPS